MWLLSGAFFPGTGSLWLSWLIRLNPLTYGVAGLRRVISRPSADLSSLPPMWLCITVTVAFALLMLVLDVWITRKDKTVK
jgi:hypothetical protein